MSSATGPHLALESVNFQNETQLAWWLGMELLIWELELVAVVGQFPKSQNFQTSLRKPRNALRFMASPLASCRRQQLCTWRKSRFFLCF